MMEGKRMIRVLIAKAGLDGHDRGAKVVARSLCDAGMYVVYTGIRQTPEAIVRAAVQEDVDVIGLSTLSGAHLEILPRIIIGLKELSAKEVLIVAGGIIPDEDIPQLKEIGVREVFGPGTPASRIVEFIRCEAASGRCT
jgi:methylmalonyl-CoA mutase C-terminal domain/subunit